MFFTKLWDSQPKLFTTFVTQIKQNRSYESEREQGKGRYMGVFERMEKRAK